MNRVLLFVRSGNARPKCVKAQQWSGESAEMIRYVREVAASKPTPTSPEWALEIMTADYWWLVLCRDAAHGRRVIAHRNVRGRILASGVAAWVEGEPLDMTTEPSGPVIGRRK